MITPAGTVSTERVVTPVMPPALPMVMALRSPTAMLPVTSAASVPILFAPPVPPMLSGPEPFSTRLVAVTGPPTWVKPPGNFESSVSVPLAAMPWSA